MTGKGLHRRVAATLTVLLALASAALVEYWSRDFSSHVVELSEYLAEGEGLPPSDDAELNVFLARMARGSGTALHAVPRESSSLSPESRKRIIQRFGKITLKENSDFVVKEYLPSAYREYLTDRVILLGAGLSDRQRGDWARIVDAMGRALGRRSAADYINARVAAEKFLQESKLPSELQSAQNTLALYKYGAALSDDEFLIGTEPSSAELDHLILHAPSTSAPTTAAIEFDVFEIGSARRIGAAKARLAKVFYELQILRPWFRDELIDDSTPLSPELDVKYFGVDGLLRIVPRSLVVHLGTDVVFDVDASTAERVGEVMNGSLCCDLRSSQLNVALAPSSVKRVGNTRFRARTPPGDPRIVAVASTRRSAQ